MSLRVVTTIASATVTFGATNIDDLVVLSVLFGQGNRTRRVVAGQYLGFAIIVGLSAALSVGALALPRTWIGLLGLAPLFLGFRGLVRLRRPAETDEPRGVLSVWSIAAVTLANGGDNVGVYAPLFTTTRGLDLAVVLVVFAVLVAVWCAIAHAFIRMPRIAQIFERWGHRLAPGVLIALGLYILIDAGSFSLVTALLR
jgi:cadmium resistance protein CadD (predicted permease)